MTFSLCQQFLTDFFATDSEQSPLNFGFTLLDSDWSRTQLSNWKVDLCGLQITQPVFADVPTAYTSFVEGHIIRSFRVPHLILADVSVQINARDVFEGALMGRAIFLTFLS